MNYRERGLTLIELMVAMALAVVLGLLIAALVNGWLQVRERLDTAERPAVLSFCLAMEPRFDGISLRQLYEQRLPLPMAWIDWQPDLHQLQWTALAAWPPAAGATRLQRQRLRYEPGAQRLALYSSDDLYAVSTPRWVLRETISPVAQTRFSFRQGQRWLAYPSQAAAQPNRGVRIDFQYRGEPYVCTFALPDLRP